MGIAWILRGQYSLGVRTKGVCGVLAEALAAKLVTEGQYDCKTDTFEELV